MGLRLCWINIFIRSVNVYVVDQLILIGSYVLNNFFFNFLCEYFYYSMRQDPLHYLFSFNK